MIKQVPELVAVNVAAAVALFSEQPVALPPVVIA